MTFKYAGLPLLSNRIPADRCALLIDCEQMTFQQINGSVLKRLYSLYLGELSSSPKHFLNSKK